MSSGSLLLAVGSAVLIQGGLQVLQVVSRFCLNGI